MFTTKVKFTVFIIIIAVYSTNMSFVQDANKELCQGSDTRDVKPAGIYNKYIGDIDTVAPYFACVRMYQPKGLSGSPVGANECHVMGGTIRLIVYVLLKSHNFTTLQNMHAH